MIKKGGKYEASNTQTDGSSSRLSTVIYIRYSSLTERFVRYTPHAYAVTMHQTDKSATAAHPSTTAKVCRVEPKCTFFLKVSAMESDTSSENVTKYMGTITSSVRLNKFGSPSVTFRWLILGNECIGVQICIDALALNTAPVFGSMLIHG